MIQVILVFKQTEQKRKTKKDRKKEKRYHELHLYNVYIMTNAMLLFGNILPTL
mgnify:CR=1 FL=1